MRVYLVGGAVRDQLLGLPVNEHDWVVVGATPAEMLQRGYRQVGKYFPVFLHPITQEEYALARTERKIAAGYTGFACYADPEVTLEEDLQRRDLTINAIAMDAEQRLIDPYQGQRDLAAGILRHVSPAFSEDPVRILRIARFSARFPQFTVAPETQELMRQMAASGEVAALVPERVWQELVRALSERAAERFFETLSYCQALPIVLPEFAEAYEASLHALCLASAHTLQPLLRFAALCQPLSIPVIQSLSARLRIPSVFTELALAVNSSFEFYQQEAAPSAQQLVDYLLARDALRKPERFVQTLELLRALTNDTQRAQYLSESLLVLKNVAVVPLLQQGLTGNSLAQALHAKRVHAMQEWRINSVWR